MEHVRTLLKCSKHRQSRDTKWIFNELSLTLQFPLVKANYLDCFGEECAICSVPSNLSH